MARLASRQADEPLVDTQWLVEHLEDPSVRVVEVDVSAAAYDEKHVPGAVLWNAYADLRHGDYTPIDTPELEQLFGRHGIAPETTVVFYGYAAHLGHWLAKAHGHERALLVDGPREQWPGPWSREPADPTPTTRRLAPPTRSATREELLEFDGVVVDVRTEGEYAGERFWPSGAPEERGRAGHVPGAINMPVTELRSESGFKPVTELRAAIDRRGLTADARVAAYCTIGNRASQAWFALTHLLGFADVAVYYGGWAEWGTDPTLAVA